MTALDQTAPLSADRRADIVASLERAHIEIGEVCAQGPRDRFRMSVPADPDRDTDLIVSAALDGAQDLLVEVDRLSSERDKARETAKHMAGALVKVGTMLEQAFRAAVSSGDTAGMTVIADFMADGDVLPAAPRPVSQDGDSHA